MMLIVILSTAPSLLSPLRLYSPRIKVNQCFKCLLFDHKTGDCTRSGFICFACAGPHRAFECPRAPQQGAYCANCGGNHVAIFAGCPIYEKAKAKQELERYAASLKRIFQLAGIPTGAHCEGCGGRHAPIFDICPILTTSGIRRELDQIAADAHVLIRHEDRRSGGYCSRAAALEGPRQSGP